MRAAPSSSHRVCGVGRRAAGAQEIDRTLPSQLSAPTRATLERLIDSARVAGLPVDPLYSKVREGSFVGGGAPCRRRRAAPTRDLGDARSALGDSAGAEEIAAGANALRAGPHPLTCRACASRAAAGPIVR